MNMQSSDFKQEADKIRVAPPRSAWKRVESQLDAESTRRKFKIVRIINYAAAIGLIAAIAVFALYYSASQSWDSAHLYSLSLEEIPSISPAQSTIYDVEKVKDLTAYFVSE